MDKNSIIQKLRQELPFLQSEFGVTHIGLFGSYTSGKYDEKSDIDLIVEFEQPVGFLFFELINYLEKILGKKVDIITSQGLNSIRHEDVKKNIEGSILYV